MAGQTKFARVIRLQGGDPSKAEDARRRWKEEIYPVLKQQPGFRGVSTMRNPKTADSLNVTYWDSEKALRDATAKVQPIGDKIRQATGRRIVEEDECEVVVEERFQPPKAGTYVRVTTLDADPTKAGTGIETYKSKVVPTVRQQPGARAAILLLNRKTGRTFSGTIWDTEDALRRSESAVSGIRQEAAQAVGARSPKVEAFEVTFTEIPTPVTANR
jgi:heme-degrading monooxygenase HmoA